jgi:MYND finger
MAPGNNRICAYSKCKVPLIDDELQSCGGCGQVYYCCRECQVGDWKAHKKACKEACKKARAAATRDIEKEVVEGAAAEAPIEVALALATASRPTDVDQGGCVRMDRCASSQCGRPLDASTRMVCTGCRRVCYCSKACQRVDWKGQHRKACKQSQHQGQGRGQKEK